MEGRAGDAREQRSVVYERGNVAPIHVIGVDKEVVGAGSVDAVVGSIDLFRAPADR